MIKFHCSLCDKKIGVPDNYAGKRVKCPQCHQAVVVPEPEESQIVPELALNDAALSADLLARVESAVAPASHPTISAGSKATHHPADPSAIKCPTCGAAINPESEFCISCGQSRPVIPAPAGKQPRTTHKLLPIIGIGAVVVILAVVLWAVVSKDSKTNTPGSDKTQTAKMTEAEKYAESYIKLLTRGEIDKAQKLLVPELQATVQKNDLEEFARHLTDVNTSLMDCTLKSVSESPQGEQFCFCYDLDGQGTGPQLVMSVMEIKQKLMVDGIAWQDPNDKQIAIGPSSFDQLQQRALEVNFSKDVSFISKYIFSFIIVLLVLGLIQVVSLWIIFNRAGHPGWAVLVPFYNLWVLAECADKPGWMGLAMGCSGAIPVVGPIVGLVFTEIIALGLAKVYGRGILFGLGLGLLPFIFYPILAFGKN